MIGLSVATLAPTAHAAVTAGTSSGVGIDVGVSALSLVDLDVGPLAQSSGTAPAAYSTTNFVATVNSSVVLGSVAATDDGDGAINTSASSDVDGSSGAKLATSNATVNGLGVTLIPGIVLTPDFLSITSDTITSTSSSSGDFGSLVSTGSAIIENLSITIAGTDLLVGINNPSPNTVIVDAGGIAGLTIVLNEQIPSGDGISSTGMTTNALRVSLDAITVGAVSGLTGDIVIGQTTSGLAAVPEPAVSLLGGLGLIGLLRRRRS
ncbi:hypothetical protein Hsar01_00224 [Haloferula sargassicola]|uniref:Ice-binding protein C-terminal domain-containing protein n=2 Tax=Haloferula sargassicola TaxID=490096 RepID=A0ABP9ULW2_9BACT